MPESKNLPQKESRLPAVVPTSSTQASNASSTAVRRLGFMSALDALAPLAVEVIYGLTKKWLYETTNSGAGAGLRATGKL